jgi:hypothetical protein
VHLETESDSEGKFAIDSVPAGSYTLTAQAPGMTTQQRVRVSAGANSDLSFELKVQEIVESASVSANADDVNSKQGAWNQHNQGIGREEHAESR